MKRPGHSPDELAQLRTTVAELEETIRLMEEQRDEQLRRRRRNLLVIGVSVSLLVHTALMIYLNIIERSRPPSGGTQPASVEFAVIQDPELTQLEELQFEELVPETPIEAVEAAEEPALELDVSSMTDVEVISGGAAPTLSGSGDGRDAALGGGGVGTSFFGISSQGRRFAYIVDVSGSMVAEGKLDAALGELARSVEALPDFAHFHVLLFATRRAGRGSPIYFMKPPFQHGWVRARRSRISDLIQWMNRVDASGGTQPKFAFIETFGLEPRPDVVFFLTDGEIPNEQETLNTVIYGNRRGRRVVVNTIAFGDDASQDLLREIARRTGGAYRYVPTGRW